MSKTFDVEIEEVLDILPIDRDEVLAGYGRITIESLKVWIGEADAILTNLLRMNGASVSSDEPSLSAGRAAIKYYAAANACLKINSNEIGREFMAMWKAERLIFAQTPREIAGAVPTSTQVRSNITTTTEETCQKKKYGRKNFSW
jgi:hypothetical protein